VTILGVSAAVAIAASSTGFAATDSWSRALRPGIVATISITREISVQERRGDISTIAARIAVDF
jgi:hypothetical protein